MEAALRLLYSFFSFGLITQGYNRLTKQLAKRKSFLFMSTFLLLLVFNSRCISRGLDEKLILHN